jgi:hypothetical protein
VRRCAPAQMEAVIGMLSAVDPGEPASTWDLLLSALKDGFQTSIGDYKNTDPWNQGASACKRPTNA